MTRPPKIPRPHRTPVTSSPAIAALGQHPDPQVVHRFWSDTAGTLPLMESSGDERIVTFCWRDADAEDVLLFINRITDETHLQDSLMHNVPGTDIWHRSYRMDSDWRASYAFIPHYGAQPAPWAGHVDHAGIRAVLDRGWRDPGNDDTCRNRVGAVHSVVSMPDAPPQPWLHPRASRCGRVTTVPGPDDRRVWMYEPWLAAEPDHRLPVLVVLDGDVWTSTQSLATTLDNLISDGVIRPSYALMLDSSGRQKRWHELDPGQRFERYIVQRLLPWARERYTVSADARDVTVIGQSLGALTALRTGILHGDVVGNVLAQSASLWLDDLASLIACSVRNHAWPRIYLESGRQEWVLAEPHQQLARRLRNSGADVMHIEYNGGHDYACWRGGLADGLDWLSSRSKPGCRFL